MGIISWILFGAVAGWLASMVMGKNNQQGWMGNIIVGIAGSVIGGLIWSLFDDDGVSMDWSIGSMAIAIGGSVVLLFLYNLFTGRR